MKSKYLFHKRKLNKKKILFFLFTIMVIIFLIYDNYFKNKKNIFLVIPENNEIFYIVPKDKGGENVPNLDKKSLNFNQKEIFQNKIKKSENLAFSIQFYVDSDLEKVNNILKKLNNAVEKIYNLEDFYILPFTSEIGTDYFLLYKNFKNKIDAETYCLKFLNKIDDCFIVDTSKF